MSLTLSDNHRKQLDQFNNLTVEKLVREDIGSAGFSKLHEKLTTIRSMINDLIAIATTAPDISNIYLDVLFNYISAYNSHGSKLVQYNPDANNSTQTKHTIINAVEGLYTYMLTGVDSTGQRPANMTFVALYSVLKQRQFDNISSNIIDVENNKAEFIDLKTKTEQLLATLQDKAKEVSLHDYSEIFSKQAELHSKWDRKNLGSAQIWLISTFVLISLFICFISKIEILYPINISANATIITIEYLTRVLIISFFIYLITFCAKQFNIQQHLSIVNKHRENTLNSYKLFIDSLGDSNSEIKHALMMEVAKAIYDSGQTGYLGSNDKSEGSPSLIEMTKYVSGNK